MKWRRNSHRCIGRNVLVLGHRIGRKFVPRHSRRKDLHKWVVCISGWLIGWLVGWLVSLSVRLVGLLIGRLVCLLVGYLIGWLVIFCLFG